MVGASSVTALSGTAASLQPANNKADGSASFFSRVKSHSTTTLKGIGKVLDKCVNLAFDGAQAVHNYIGGKITKDNAGAAFFSGLALSVGGIAGMALGGPAGVVFGIGSLCVGLSMMHRSAMTSERYGSLFTPTNKDGSIEL